MVLDHRYELAKRMHVSLRRVLWIELAESCSLERRLEIWDQVVRRVPAHSGPRFRCCDPVTPDRIPDPGLLAGAAFRGVGPHPLHIIKTARWPTLSCRTCSASILPMACNRSLSSLREGRTGGLIVPVIISGSI